LENLNNQEVEVVQRDTHDLWSGGSSLEARILKVQALLNYPDRPLRCIGLKNNGLIYCSAKIYDCDAVLEGDAIRILGVGSLFTRPEMRNQGYARKMMHEISNLAKVGGYKGVWLWSDIGSEFYQTMDFETMPIRRVSYQVENTSELPEGVVVAPAQVEDALEINDLFRSAIQDFPFRVIRKANCWNFWRLLNRSVDFKITLKKELIGYFTASQDITRDYYWIDECFANPGREEIVKNAILDRANYHGKSFICGWNSIRSVFSESPFKDTIVTKPIPMVKLFAVIDRDRFSSIQKHYLSSVDHF